MTLPQKLHNPLDQSGGKKSKTEKLQQKWDNTQSCWGEKKSSSGIMAPQNIEKDHEAV